MANQYTTVPLVESELRATTVFSDDTVPTYDSVVRWIEEVSSKIDHDAGICFASTSYTEVINNPSVENYIYLKHAPLVSVSSVEYNSKPIGVSPEWTARTETTDYVVQSGKGRILLTNRWSPQTGEHDIFRVTYTAGYSSTPLTIQQLATKMVTERILSSLLNNDISEGNNGGSVNVGSIAIVEPADFGIGKFKRLREEIQELQQDLTKNFGVYRYSGY